MPTEGKPVGKATPTPAVAAKQKTARPLTPAPNAAGFGGSGGYGIIPTETVPTTDPYAAAASANHGQLLHASEQEIVQWINDNYSPAQSHLLQIPELHDAVIEAARKNMSPADALVQIEKTQWWQQRSESMRSMDMLATTDPVEFQAQVDRKMAALVPEWTAYGVDGDVRQMAQDALRLGYTDDQIRVLLADRLQTESSWDGLDTGSKGAADAAELMRIARQEYLTPMPQGTAEQWAIRGVREGTDIIPQWRQYLASISTSRFGIAPDSGITPGDLMAPIRASIADNLEINADSIDLLDPKYNAVLQVPTDDGHYRPMTSFEATKWARSQAGFNGTKTASDAAASLADSITKTFGGHA